MSAGWLCMCVFVLCLWVCFVCTVCFRVYGLALRIAGSFCMYGLVLLWFVCLAGSFVGKVRLMLFVLCVLFVLFLFIK